jgi:heptosyltransferase III
MQRILVVRSGGLGDTLLTLPAIRALRGRCPDASIEVAGNTEHWSLARDFVDAIHHVDDPAIAEIFTSGPMHNFRRKFSSVDLLISWSSRELRASEHLPKLVSASPYPPPGVHASDWLVTTLIDKGILESSSDERAPWLTLSAAAKRQAEAVLSSLGLSDPILVHPGAGAAWKRWPSERFAELGKKLLSRGHEVAMLVGPADDEVVSCGDTDPIAVIREVELPTVAALLGRSAAFTGNDSGISHLAAAVGTPGIALFGPTDPTSWEPRGSVEVVRKCVKTATHRGHIRVCEDADCMSLVTVSQVSLALEKVLGW